MSKLKRTLIYVVIAVAATIALATARYQINDYRSKGYLKDQYQRIAIPATLRQTKSNYVKGGVDTNSYWAYGYDTSANRSQLYGELEQAIQVAGFTIHNFSASQSSLPIGISADGPHSTLTVMLFPADSPPAATVNHVNIIIEKR